MAKKAFTIRSNSGSALLVALMIMGILLTLSLGVSQLLVGTLRDSRQLLEKTKAWYAAESGIEHALLKIAENPPGFEYKSPKINLEQNASSYEYDIKATANKIPEKEPFEIQKEEDNFALLHLNESAVIPLFRGDAPDDLVQQFRVDYYLAPDLKLRSGYVNEDLDILRWKIFGIAKDGVNKGKMEVINEFLPMESGKNTEVSPTCFGTQFPLCWNTAKYYQYHASGNIDSPEFDVIQEYPIQEFLSHHTQNFLVLSNVVNVNLIAPTALDISLTDKKKIANINYRVTDLTPGANSIGRLTLPTIKITSDGYAGTSKQSLNLDIKRETFLPVFNYALYRTAD